MSEMLKHALHYASLGWHVFPLKPGSKMPFKDSHAHLDATTDRAQIESWWTREPNANIGISLEPSGLVVLDVDVGLKADGTPKPGAASLQQLYEAHPDITATLRSITPTGGVHDVYSRPAGCPANRAIDFLARAVEGQGKGSGLDLLGLGFIVAAPSVRNGKRYSWANSEAIAPLPASLSAVYSAKAPKIERPEQGAEGSVYEGGRDNALFKLGCSLREKGIIESTLLAALENENAERCDPPLPDADVERIVQSVMQRVIPHGDVLLDAQFFDTLMGNAPAPIVPTREGRISIPLSQLGDWDPPVVRMYPTGYPELDRLMGGGICSRGSTVVIAPPGAGKSSLALNVCLHQRAPVLYISTELENAEIRARIAAQVIGMPWLKIMKGQVPKAEIIEALKKHPHVQIMDRESFQRGTAREMMQQISAEIYAISQDFGMPPFIALDYMQDLARAATEKREAVGELAMYLRAMAPAHDAPILVVSSTSRGWYGAKPEITDAVAFQSAAKESGDVDFDASNILYVDVLPDQSKGYREARVAVAKCRHGELGFVGMRYHGALGGRWEHAPDALGAFDPQVQESKKHNARTSDDRRAVLARIADKGGDPRGVLKHNCGMPPARADATILEMLKDGVLEMRREERIGLDHKTRMVDIVALPLNKS